MGLTFASEILNAHVVDWSQVLNLILCLEVQRASGVELWYRVKRLFVPRAVLTESENRIFFSTSIRLELERSMIAAFTCKEEKARLEDIDTGSGCHGIKELNLHRVDLLLGEVQRQFVQISILTLKHKEECVKIENGITRHEKTSSQIMSSSHWNVTNSVLMINLLVDKEVFTDHNYSTRTNAAWHLYEHVCGLVYGEDVLSDDMVETKVHFV